MSSLKNSQVRSRVLFEAIGSYKLSQSVDAPSTKLSFFLCSHLYSLRLTLCATATATMASDPSELMLEERMTRLQTDGAVLGLGSLMGQSEYVGSGGGDEAVHGASPRGVPAQLFLAAGGQVIKEEVEDGVELFVVENPAGSYFCGGFIGRERSRFCCLQVYPGSHSCPVEGHIWKAPVLVDHAYIRCLPTSRGPRMDAAFVSPALNMKDLSEVILLELEGRKTIETWSRLFSLIESGVGVLVGDDEVMEILARQQREVSFAPTTPAKRRKMMEMDATMEEEDVKPHGAIVSRLSPSTEATGDLMAVVVANWNKVHL